MVMEESIEINRFVSGGLVVVRRGQLWLLGLPKGCWGSLCHWRVHTNTKKDGVEAMQKAIACCFWSKKPGVL